MSKLKIINLINLPFFGALLAMTAVHCLKPPQVEASLKLVWLEPANVQSDRDLSLAYGDRLITFSNETSSQTELLVQAASTDINENNTERTRSIGRLVLTFFLLFFVPLGIFYPLFLFYKMLLIKPEDDRRIVFNEHQAEIKDFPSSATIPTKKDLTKATVSKLQIAFTPPAQELRKELSRVSSLAGANVKGNLVKLMHQTVEVLIEQKHWTHINHSSLTLPLDLVKPEFDSISKSERHKFNTKQPNSGDRNLSSNYERNYSYVVVTLILCTTHDSPLFRAINTKEQLVGQLERLRKMKQDSIIKFELLWNPQQEGIYLSNDCLLTEYAEMTRLF